MEIRNKKVVFLGDSITQGVGASSFETKYTRVFEKNTGAIVYNFGISGTRIARQASYNINDPFDKDFNMRVDSMSDEADVVVVFGGTNDFGHGDAPLGDFSSRSVDTFYGALHTLIIKLYNKYPNARIVFMTPLHRLGETTLINSRGLRRLPLINYVNAIREVCEFYSVAILDLYKDSGMTPEIPLIKELYMPDGLHPSDLGMKRIAEMLESFLISL